MKRIEEYQAVISATGAVETPKTVVVETAGRIRRISVVDAINQDREPMQLLTVMAATDDESDDIDDKKRRPIRFVLCRPGDVVPDYADDLPFLAAITHGPYAVYIHADDMKKSLPTVTKESI